MCVSVCGIDWRLPGDAEQLEQNEHYCQVLKSPSLCFSPTRPLMVGGRIDCAMVPGSTRCAAYLLSAPHGPMWHEV